ncbi:DNA polymerase V [Paenibacillus enshidis]|uniref:DNA polymerase V n=1 Tax=Paenibacillus enshidis TaxID=1458439 RepID=A0ABV5AYN5_9BACL
MVDYSRLPRHQVLCIDMKSFYASVEAVNRKLDPLTALIAVVGAKDRPGSVVLAASPALKKEFGIRTGNRLYEIPPDPRIHIINARMGLYLDTSMAITQLLNEFAPVEAIHTYSVDEAWIVTDGLEKLYGNAHQVALKIQERIRIQLGLPSAIGIGPNKLLAKLVLDNYAKKSGIAECRYEDVARMLWPLPVEDIWGIGYRMKRNLNMLGIYVLGDLANYSLPRLKMKFGVMGEQIYYHAWGVDLSPVFVDPAEEIRKGFSNGITLMRDYSAHEIPTVIYELTDHIASRMREIHAAGRTVSLSLGYSKHEGLRGFSRSRTLPEATNISKRLYDACMALVGQANIMGKIRTIHVGVSNLVNDDAIQLDLFSGPADEKLRQLGSAIDSIQARFGGAAVFRACSLTDAGTFLNRTQKIGGHYQ